MQRAHSFAEIVRSSLATLEICGSGLSFIIDADGLLIERIGILPN